MNFNNINEIEYIKDTIVDYDQSIKSDKGDDLLADDYCDLLNCKCEGGR